jgi:hypothetical protein
VQREEKSVAPSCCADSLLPGSRDRHVSESRLGSWNQTLAHFGPAKVEPNLWALSARASRKQTCVYATSRERGTRVGRRSYCLLLPGSVVTTSPQ